MMLDPKKDRRELRRAAPASGGPVVEPSGFPPMSVDVPVGKPTSVIQLPSHANDAQPADAYRTVLRCRTRRESD